jgi:hypothetical protein
MTNRKINKAIAEHLSDKEYIKKLEEALSESLSLNINWTEDASDEDLNYYSEHRAVIKQAKETLKLSKNPNMHNF